MIKEVVALLRVDGWEEDEDGDGDPYWEAHLDQAAARIETAVGLSQ